MAINPKILFIAESATLAHVVRPLLLAQSLSPSDFALYFACGKDYDFVFKGCNFKRINITSRSPKELFLLLDKGGCLFDEEILRSYIKEEGELFSQIKPDVVVSDFRPSVGVSAAKARIPHCTLTNAYWSPYAVDRRIPFPCLGGIRRLGLRGYAGSALIGALNCINKVTVSSILAQQAKGLDTLRVENGLSPFPDYFSGFTHGDYVLYCDTPLISPTRDLPAHHRYLGPLCWSPDIKLPAWWSEIPKDRPLMYISLGSSGLEETLPKIFNAVRTKKVSIVLTTAGKEVCIPKELKVYVSDFLPGDIVTRSSALVISNGGSPTTYQALKEGTPVIGIASNMDQLVFMHGVERARAGIALRSDILSPAQIARSIDQILNDSIFALSAKKVASEARQFDPFQIFRSTLNDILGEEKSYERMYNM